MSTQRIFSAMAGSFAALAFIVFASSTALAHSRLVGAFKPRNSSSGIKMGPCGGDPRGTTPAVFQAGSTVQIQWEETIHHTGHFEFYFSVNDESTLFTPTNTNLNMILSVPNDATGVTLPSEFSHQITLPNTVCDTCTVQLIQVMLDSHPTAPTYYFSCADVRLVKDTTAVPPTPTPTPVPTPCK